MCNEDFDFRYNPVISARETSVFLTNEKEHSEGVASYRYRKKKGRSAFKDTMSCSRSADQGDLSDSDDGYVDTDPLR